ncbi:MAG: ABC transporter permease [Chloroflexota bacterium]
MSSKPAKTGQAGPALLGMAGLESLSHLAASARSEATKRANKERQLRRISIYSPIVLIVLWQVLPSAGMLDPRFFPPPSQVLATAVREVVSGQLPTDLAASLSRIFIGFLLGAVPGLVIGLAMALVPMLRDILEPILMSLLPLPKLAILPLLMLIFGLGETSKWVLIASGVFFLVMMNTTTGILGVDKIYLDVAYNFGARGMSLYRRVILPAAVPAIFAGIKLAAGMALLLVVAAEFDAAKTGVGFRVLEAWERFGLRTMIVDLAVLGILGYLLNIGMNAAERRVVPWKYQ